MDVISRVPQPPLTPNPLFWKFLPKNRKNRNPSPALPLGMEHWKWKGESLLYIVLLSMPLYVTAKVVWHFVSLHVWHFVSCKIMYDTLHHFMSFIENRGVWHKSVWHKKCDLKPYLTLPSSTMLCTRAIRCLISSFIEESEAGLWKAYKYWLVLIIPVGS